MSEVPLYSDCAKDMYGVRSLQAGTLAGLAQLFVGVGL